MNDTPTLIPLRFAARRLRIPMRWLRGEALACRIPCLDADGMKLVDPVAESHALAARAVIIHAQARKAMRHAR